MSIKFSIIIATYNYGKFIHNAINSILEQRSTLNPQITYEIIVVDDCSTDDTKKVIESFNIIENNIKSLINPINLGPAKSRNLGIEKATGDYIIFLDADDWLTEDSLNKIYQFIIENNKPSVIISDHNNINYLDNNNPLKINYNLDKNHIENNNNLVKSSKIKNKNLSPDKNTRFINYLFKKKISLTAGSVIYDRQVLYRFQYAEDLKLNEDLPLFAHVLVNYDCLYLDYATVNILKHSGSLRNHYEKLTEQSNVIDLTNVIFYPDALPLELMRLKNKYLGQRYLSLFRSFYRAEQYKQAKLFYRKALAVNYFNLLKLNYFMKYLRILFT